VKTIALKATKKKVKVSFEDDFENEEEEVALLAKNFRRLMRNDKFKKKLFGRLKKAPESSNLRKLRRKIQEAPDVLNAQTLGIYGLIVEISSREKGRLIMRLSVMSLKKKNLLIKTNL
jgi:hypothetical protein